MLLAEPCTFVQKNEGSANYTIGSTVTPGTSNSKGGWAQVAASTAQDCYFLSLAAAGFAANATDRNVLLDVAVGASGSEVAIISDLIIGKTDSMVTGNGRVFNFPLFIPAGSRISVRAQEDGVGAATGTARFQWLGSPSRPEAFPVCSGVETIGAVTGSIGVAIASGATNAFTGSIGSSAGDWHLLGTTTRPCRWWQIGFSISNATINSATLRAQIGVGDGSAVTPIMDQAYYSTTTERVYDAGFVRHPWPYFEVATGASIYARVCSSLASPDSGAYVLAYGAY